MELGVYTFGDVLPDPHTGTTPTVADRYAELLEYAVMAEQGGLDVFAIGEHHRHDFPVSAPEMLLAAIASRTEKIRLSSAVTVLSTQDPVRVWEQYATLDQLSRGRAEILAGRGAFVESFPLFGYALEEYEELFDDRIDLLLQLRDSDGDPLSWNGRTRAPLQDAIAVPTAHDGPLPVWIGVGGTPSSAMRAGRLGAPMFLALWTNPSSGRRLVDLYRRSAADSGHAVDQLSVASGGHMFIGRTSQGARDQFFPYYSAYFRFNPRFGEAGMSRDVFDHWADNGLAVGSPQQVIDVILTHRNALGIDRYIGQFDTGSLPRSLAGESLELYLTEVAPVLRRETAGG